MLQDPFAELGEIVGAALITRGVPLSDPATPGALDATLILYPLPDAAAGIVTVIGVAVVAVTVPIVVGEPQLPNASDN